MAEQKLIKKYNGIISEVQTEIKKLENDTRVLNKLYVILDVLHDEPINDMSLSKIVMEICYYFPKSSPTINQYPV